MKKLETSYIITLFVVKLVEVHNKLAHKEDTSLFYFVVTIHISILCSIKLVVVICLVFVWSIDVAELIKPDAEQGFLIILHFIL